MKLRFAPLEFFASYKRGYNLDGKSDINIGKVDETNHEPTVLAILALLFEESSRHCQSVTQTVENMAQEAAMNSDPKETLASFTTTWDDYMKSSVELNGHMTALNEIVNEVAEQILGRPKKQVPPFGIWRLQAALFLKICHTSLRGTLRTTLVSYTHSIGQLELELTKLESPEAAATTTATATPSASVFASTLPSALGTVPGLSAGYSFDLPIGLPSSPSLEFSRSSPQLQPQLQQPLQLQLQPQGQTPTQTHTETADPFDLVLGLSGSNLNFDFAQTSTPADVQEQLREAIVNARHGFPAVLDIDINEVSVHSIHSKSLISPECAALCDLLCPVLDQLHTEIEEQVHDPLVRTQLLEHLLNDLKEIYVPCMWDRLEVNIRSTMLRALKPLLASALAECPTVPEASESGRAGELQSEDRVLVLAVEKLRTARKPMLPPEELGAAFRIVQQLRTTHSTLCETYVAAKLAKDSAAHQEPRAPIRLVVSDLKHSDAVLIISGAACV